MDGLLNGALFRPVNGYTQRMPSLTEFETWPFKDTASFTYLGVASCDVGATGFTGAGGDRGATGNTGSLGWPGSTGLPGPPGLPARRRK